MKPHEVIATWFGLGFIRKAPGTMGSLGAIPFGLAIHHFFGVEGLLEAAAAVTIVGCWAANEFQKKSGKSDDQRIVVDEVAGQWIALLPAALDPFLILVSFILFRLFDIKKPWPCRRLEKIPGGVGVMADDVAAGIYAALIVAGLRYAGIG